MIPGKATLSSKAIAALFISLSFISSSKAQTLLQTFSEPNTNCVTSEFGRSVSIAGDVNHDGYDDMIVGAPNYNGLRGCAYLFYGGENADTVYDVLFIGQTHDSQFGSKVSGAGDVNNDGYDDIMVSAYMESDISGAVYIYYGGNPMDANPDVIIRGNHMIGFTGYSIAALGDLNKDGFDDIIVGEKSGQYDIYGFGKAQVFYGGSNMDNSPDITFYGQGNIELFGGSVASAGDVNSDGFTDIIVGAIGEGLPKAYIYFGGENMDNKADIIINGAECIKGFATSLSSAGDVNHDGYDDIIIGYYIGTKDIKGKAYIYFGGDSMDNTPDITLTSPVSSSSFGFDVAGGTDLDKDGYDDVIVGCFYYPYYSTSKSYVYVYKGGAEMDSEPDLILENQKGFEDFGFSVSMSGDVNNDGTNDILVGSRFGYINGSGAFLYFAGSELDSISDYTFRDAPGGNYSGYVVSPAGDMNGDGYDDFLMSAQYYNNSKGRVYLYLGGNEIDNQADVLFNAPVSVSNFGNSVSAAGDCNQDGFDDIIICGSKASYIYFGGNIIDNTPDVVLPGTYQYKSVISAGDFNHDGFDDVIVGLNNNTTSGGDCKVYYGGSPMDNAADLTLSGNYTHTDGKSVSSGDINHDGYSDLIITTEIFINQNKADQILVFLGGDEPDGIPDFALQTGSPTTEFKTNSMAIVDFNHDGFDDILVGAPLSANGTGKAYLFFGGDVISTSPDLVFEGKGEGDNFGMSVSSTGDLNNDGIDDIIIGGAYIDSYKGSAYIYFGGVQPDTTADIELKGEDFLTDFGYSVCSPGDMNFDGYPEIAVGSPRRLSNGVTYLYDFHTAKKEQVISFDAPETLTYGKTPFALTASSNSGLPVIYTVSDNASALINDNTITILGAGPLTITAHQPGNLVYNPAPDISRNLEISKADLEISAKDTSKTEGSVNPQLLMIYNGFVNSDNADDIDVLPAITTEATTGSPVGTYPITLTGGTDNNYNLVLIDGTLTVKEFTGIDRIEMDGMLYPNPAHRYVIIPADNSDCEFSIYNIMGKIVLKQTLKENRIDISGLDAGCYLLEISGRRYKFIKD
ncbi:MAG TPA: FG-GAP-like repeat-containing protein [Bacteroidales bacterium]|nr:FG-GAP-like repeat-containing protein [Bacteroidales bacterium]